MARKHGHVVAAELSLLLKCRIPGHVYSKFIFWCPLARPILFCMRRSFSTTRRDLQRVGCHKSDPVKLCPFCLATQVIYSFVSTAMPTASIIDRLSYAYGVAFIFVSSDTPAESLFHQPHTSLWRFFFFFILAMPTASIFSSLTMSMPKDSYTSVNLKRLLRSLSPA